MQRFRDLAGSEKVHLHITALKAVQVKSCTQCLVRAETDGGMVRYAEAGGPGPMVRATLAEGEPYWA